ncbi:hypothetical protein J6590_084238, partial [Homalodisca vitripennis]
FSARRLIKQKCGLSFRELLENKERLEHSSIHSEVLENIADVVNEHSRSDVRK